MILTLIAFGSYVATLSLGVVSLRGRRVRRVWHTRMFVLTLALTVLAVALSFPDEWARGILLAIALVPLSLLPFMGGVRGGTPVHRRPAPHIVTGLAAAPCYLAGIAVWAMYPR